MKRGRKIGEEGKDDLWKWGWKISERGEGRSVLEGKKNRWVRTIC